MSLASFLKTCVIIFYFLECFCIDRTLCKTEKKAANCNSLNNEDNLLVFNNKNTNRPGYSLHGTMLRVGVWRDDPMKPFLDELLMMLSEVANFTYKISYLKLKETPDNVINTGKFDLLLILITILPERTERMTFLHPTAYVSRVFITKRHQLQGFSITDPFSTPVWLLLVLYSIIVGPILHYIDYHENLLYKEETITKCSTCQKTLEARIKEKSRAYFSQYTLSSYLQQGGTYLPQCLSARMLLGWWWIFASIMTAIYTGMLVSKLFVSKQVYPFSTLQELIENDITPVTIAQFTSTRLMKNRPEYRQLWQRMKADANVPTNKAEMALGLTATGKYTFFVHEMWAKFYLIKDYELHGKCRFSLALFSDFSIPSALVVPKKSNYTQVLNFAIAALKEHGFIDELLQRLLQPSDTCLDSPKQQVGTLSINVEQLGIVFWVLISGIGAALFTFFGEFASRRLK